MPVNMRNNTESPLEIPVSREAKLHSHRFLSLLAGKVTPVSDDVYAAIKANKSPVFQFWVDEGYVSVEDNMRDTDQLIPSTTKLETEGMYKAMLGGDDHQKVQHETKSVDDSLSAPVEVRTGDDFDARLQEKVANMNSAIDAAAQKSAPPALETADDGIAAKATRPADTTVDAKEAPKKSRGRPKKAAPPSGGKES